MPSGVQVKPAPARRRRREPQLAEPLRDLGRRRRRLAARRAAGARPPARPLDRAGRIVVEPDLSLPGHPEISVIGDLAAAQQLRAGPGAAAGARRLARRPSRWGARRPPTSCAGWRGQPTQPFRYRDYGNLATIGRNAAVVDLASPLRRASNSAATRPGCSGCSRTSTS